MKFKIGPDEKSYSGIDDKRQAEMGRSVLLYEQVYNDLTAAVARAKQACRKHILKPSTIVTAVDKKHNRGRPKGSKDTVPRKTKSNVHTIPAPSGSSNCQSVSMVCSATNQIFCAGFDQAAPYEAAYSFTTESELSFIHGAIISPTALPHDPACWELPLPF